MSGKHVILILSSLIVLTNGRSYARIDQGQDASPIESRPVNDSFPSPLDSADPELVFVEARSNSVVVKMLPTGVSSIDVTEVSVRCVDAPHLASTLEVVNRTDGSWTYKIGESPMDRCREQSNWRTVEARKSSHSAHTLFEVSGLQTDSKYQVRFDGTRHQWLNGLPLLVSSTIAVYTESRDPPFAQTGYFYVEEVKRKRRVLQLLWQKSNSLGFLATYDEGGRRKSENVIDFTVPSFATVQISTNRTTFRFQKLFRNGTRGLRSTFLHVPAHKDVLPLISWSPKYSWTGNKGAVEWDPPQNVTNVANYTLVYIGQLSMYDTFEDPIYFATIGAEEVRNITILGPAPAVFGIIVHTNLTSSGLRVLSWTKNAAASFETGLLLNETAADSSESATQIHARPAVARGANLTRSHNSTRSRGARGRGRVTTQPV